MQSIYLNGENFYVPTKRLLCTTELMTHYTSQGKHVFLAGSQGSGKSTIIDSMKFFEKDATYHQVYITPDLKPDVVQLVIEASMDKFMHNIFWQQT